jgi:Kef-type K+ transport system membrane component KefB
MIEQPFIKSLGVIIVGAALFSLAARRIKVPTIVAYLLAGLVIGPGLHLVELTASLEMISEVGIVLLLFLVGLELSLDKIRGVGRAALKAGLAQVGLTAGGGYLVSWGLGFKPVESLCLAIALTFSSTVVAVKLLEEKGQFNSLHGRLSVGILLFQDLVVLVLLTLLAGITPESKFNLLSVSLDLGKALGGMGLLIALVLLASRFLLPRPLAWAARSPSALFIWSLCWCFFIVISAYTLHLSPESGAFLAGLGLAQLPYNRDLRRRVHPLMNFFIAVFFVSLGVEMDLNAAAIPWGSALSLALFVLAGKFVILMWTLARMGYTERTAHFTATTLSQISEFSFIFTAAAVKAGWIDHAIMSLVALVGLITISLSSFLILYNEPLLAGGRRLGLFRLFRAAGSEQELPAAPARRGHVMVVGMNTMGRLLVGRLHELGERVLAIDTDPLKLAGLPCETMLGNVEYLSVLEEAGLPEAKLLVSALRIEPTNDLLAYRCRSFHVPCSIHVVDLSVVDNLLEMDANYLMIPKVDGIKLQNQKLKEMGFLKA